MRDIDILHIQSEIPLATCIITCYKKFDYLFEAIHSVLEQDYPRIELLITDDGSVGFPKEKVEKFIQDNAKTNIVRYYVNHHEQNVGTVRNINSMLKIATGDYFIGLDGDDVFCDSTVFTKIIERFISTGVDFLACSRLQCTEQLDPIKVLPTSIQKAEIKKLDTAKKQFESFSAFRFLDMVSGSAMYFSRGNLETMGLFDEKYRNWQDGPRAIGYVMQGKQIPTAYDIISIKYRDGGVSNNPEANSDSFGHIARDRYLYIQSYLIPSRRNRYIKNRRTILFHYYWDCSKTKIERIKLLLCYPEKAAEMLRKKIKYRVGRTDD